MDGVNANTENSQEKAEEVHAEAEVRLGTNHGKNTIIEVLNPDVPHAHSSTLAVTRTQRPTNQSNRIHEPSILEWIILAIRSFIEQIFYRNGDGHPLANDSLLEADEIDRLAIYQDGHPMEIYMREWISNDLSDNQKKQKVLFYWRLLENEDHIEWERRCRTVMSPSTLFHYLVKERETYRAKLRCFLGSWGTGKEFCSPNIFLLDDQLTAHRIPSVNQTDSVRGKLGFDEGIHAWDMRIMGEIGTHCSLGITTKDSTLLTRMGYLSMVGDDDTSWGWDIVWGNLSHGGEPHGKYPKNKMYLYSPGDFVRLILDCDAGVLSYAVNEKFFGVAFEGLPKAMYYPCVGLVYGNSEVALIYLGRPPPLRNSK